jgi:hypothetical protein
MVHIDSRRRRAACRTRGAGREAHRSHAPTRLRTQLESIRERDEAILREAGVATPIFDHSGHAVGAVGDTERIVPRGQAKGLVAAVTEAAAASSASSERGGRSISCELGARPGRDGRAAPRCSADARNRRFWVRDDFPIASAFHVRDAHRRPAYLASRGQVPRCPRRHLTWGARAKRPSRLPLRPSIAAASFPMPKAPSTVRSTP